MDYQTMFDLICFVGSIFSCVISFVNLLLIWRKGDWNLQVKVVTLIAFYQLIFGPSIALVGSIGDTYVIAQAILGIVGGAASSVISTVILINVLLIIRKVRWEDLKRYNSLVYINTIALFPCVVILILFFYGYLTENIIFSHIGLQIYYLIRAFSTFCNIILYIILTILLKRMIPKNSVKVSDLALLELVRRLKYYPIAQLLTRFVATFNGLKSPGSYWDDDMNTLSSFEVNATSIILDSLTSFAYLLIYIFSQPKARKLNKNKNNISSTGSNILSFASSFASIKNSLKSIPKVNNKEHDSDSDICKQEGSIGSSSSYSESTKSFLMSNPVMELTDEELITLGTGRSSLYNGQYEDSPGPGEGDDNDAFKIGISGRFSSFGFGTVTSSMNIHASGEVTSDNDNPIQTACTNIDSPSVQAI